MRRYRRPTDDAEISSDPKHTEVAAVRLLARREHSTLDLKRKLRGRGFAQDTVESVVSRLADKHLVSDSRFITSFVHHHGQRGHGPVRIRADLRQQGIEDAPIEAALSESGFDWVEQAASVRQRKFRQPPTSLAERAKQARFLQYRGFTMEHIQAAFGKAARNRGDGNAALDDDVPGDFDSDLDPDS